MPSTIPHSSVILEQLKEYLEDAIHTMEDSAKTIPSMTEYRQIYKNSLGTFTVMSRLSRRQLPLLKTACGIVKRGPLLIATRQVQLAYVELRRLIEVVSCYLYFCEHPIEWEHFYENSGDNYGGDRDKPITWAAHRELGWHLKYITERYSNDKSNLIEYAVSTNKTSYSELSKYVHASLDHITKKPLTEVFDTLDKPSLKKFSEIQKKVYRASIILVVATKPELVGKLNTIERGWFENILEKKQHMAIRSGEFLSR